MSDSLAAQAHKAAIEQVKSEKATSFTVGASYNGAVITGGVSYDRKWTNGWGLTAYAKAWWNDQAVLPQDKSGIVVGAEAVKKF